MLATLPLLGARSMADLRRVARDARAVTGASAAQLMGRRRSKAEAVGHEAD
jgi:hypothetical protein